jgi:hypothetical protein
MITATTTAAYGISAYLASADLIASTMPLSARHLTVDEDVIGRSFGVASIAYDRAQTAVSDEVPFVVGPRTVGDNLIAELSGFRDLDDGWDGENAARPNPVAIREAAKFIRAAGDFASRFEPTLHVNGSVLLEVGDGAGGSLRFNGDGKIVFALAGFERGVLAFDQSTMPEKIRAAVAT